jgi:hypothetical protein
VWGPAPQRVGIASGEAPCRVRVGASTRARGRAHLLKDERCQYSMPFLSVAFICPRSAPGRCHPVVAGHRRGSGAAVRRLMWISGRLARSRSPVGLRWRCRRSTIRRLAAVNRRSGSGAGGRRRLSISAAHHRNPYLAGLRSRCRRFTIRRSNPRAKVVREHPLTRSRVGPCGRGRRYMAGLSYRAPERRRDRSGRCHPRRHRSRRQALDGAGADTFATGAAPASA